MLNLLDDNRFLRNVIILILVIGLGLAVSALRKGEETPVPAAIKCDGVYADNGGSPPKECEGLGLKQAPVKRTQGAEF